MKYLLIPIIAITMTSCNQYNSCYDPCEYDNCQDVCAATPIKETTTLTEKEFTTKLAQLATTFETTIKEKINVTPQLTTTTTPPNGISSMMTTTDNMDIKAARKMILESAETLLDVANKNTFMKEHATKYPLTTSDLDILIDTTSKDATIRSVSLIRGVIEYEALDPETNTYKIVKKEPLTHAQARTTNNNSCCGSYFVSH